MNADSSLSTYTPRQIPHLMIITVHADCYPTEDREKVAQAIKNIFPSGEVIGDNKLTLTCTSGERLRELIWDTQIRDSARSVLLRGRSENSTSFILNKQAAFVGKISFQDDRSALGGIRVTICNDTIDDAINYLAESTVDDS